VPPRSKHKFFGIKIYGLQCPTASVDFYANVIAPYKGALEEWFVDNKGIYLFPCDLYAVWAVLVPTKRWHNKCVRTCQNLL